jgi:hypothetical protein
MARLLSLGSMFPSYWEAVAGAEIASADTRERFNLLADGNLKRITLEVDHLRPVIRNYTRHEASRCIGYHREVHLPVPVSDRRGILAGIVQVPTFVTCLLDSPAGRRHRVLSSHAAVLTGLDLLLQSIVAITAHWRHYLMRQTKAGGRRPMWLLRRIK